MMKAIVTAAAMSAAFSGAAFAQTDYSALIRDRGLAGAEQVLSAKPSLSDSDLFALGGVRFLSTVETALQSLYATQIDRQMAEQSGLPFLRLPLPPNPDAKPFYPTQIEDMFTAALGDLEESLQALDAISAPGGVGVVIDTGDLWFDVNANGARDQGEGFYEIAAPQLAGQLGGASSEGGFTPPVIRFDGSDVAWLAAYAHLLSGISETVLAVDPTEAITRVVNTRAQITELTGGELPWIIDDAWRIIDVIAMWLYAIEGQPDPNLTRSAHQHFLDMIGENKTFWTRVALETDNDREWIPNEVQDTALPLDFPPETAARWQAVLNEGEQILKGELLLPHPLISGGKTWGGNWQGPHVGINLNKFMTNPPDINLLSLIHGEAALPYMERGPLASGRSLQEFERLMRGDAGLFMVILN
jgi:hypothetical protein